MDDVPSWPDPGAWKNIRKREERGKSDFYLDILRLQLVTRISSYPISGLSPLQNAHHPVSDREIISHPGISGWVDTTPSVCLQLEN